MPKSPIVTINVTPVADIDARAAEERKRYAAKFSTRHYQFPITKCISTPSTRRTQPNG